MMKRILTYVTMGLILVSSQACQYRPVHQKLDANSTQGHMDPNVGLARTEIANIPDRAGQILRNDLIDRMNYQGYADFSDFILEVNLSESRSDLGLKRDDTSSLYVYKITASVVLRDKASDKILERFTTSAESTVNVVKEQFSVLVAAETGRKRALKQIADIIVSRLSLYFVTHDLNMERVKP